MSSPIITLKDASVIYGGETSVVRALDNVSLDIYAEEYIIFFGPSGCGKSTLLYSIAGLQQLTKGEINVLGQNLKTVSTKESVEFHRRSMGMVFQAYYLIQSLSVLANVTLPQIFVNAVPSERNKRGEELLNRFGILDQSNKFPNALSGGQQQRVAISRSLINDPPLILADEPVGNLDSKSSEEVLKLLSELNERDKKTIILVTHNPNHLGYASRIFYMQDGRIIREVRNTERKQVSEEVARPMDAQWVDEFAKLYPNLTDETLKAKMVVSYLLEEIDLSVRSRVEDVIQKYFSGQMDEQAVVHAVSMPLHEGGIGFYRSFAERFAVELHSILAMAKYLKGKFGDYPKNYDDYKEMLDKLGKYLILSTDAHPSEDAQKNFIRILQSRLEGSVKKENFEELLDRAVSLGGIGFNIRTARKITRHLELLLMDYPNISTTQEVSTSTPAEQTVLAVPIAPNISKTTEELVASNTTTS